MTLQINGKIRARYPRNNIRIKKSEIKPDAKLNFERFIQQRFYSMTETPVLTNHKNFIIHGVIDRFSKNQNAKQKNQPGRIVGTRLVKFNIYHLLTFVLERNLRNAQML